MGELSPEQRAEHLKSSVKLQPADVEGVKLLGVVFRDQTFGVYLDDAGKLDGVTEVGELGEDRDFIKQVILEKYAQLYPDQDAKAVEQALG
jgi:hypothetical protein